ncbi:MAG: hypothetical protein ACFB02_18750 [Mastigocoleus sp.]
MFGNTVKIIFDFSKSLKKSFNVSISLVFLVTSPTFASVIGTPQCNDGTCDNPSSVKIANNLKLLNLFSKKSTPPLLLRDSNKKKINTPQRRDCTGENITTLVNKMLLDLPGYANRATQRARRLDRANEVYSYILLAGKPEFEPLKISSEEYLQTKKNSREKVEQVFFTTLERQYIKGKIVELQQFHWMLLTKSSTGWRMVMMFSQISSYPQNEISTPPRDSSNGVIGQAAKTWLRDCRAGSL